MSAGPENFPIKDFKEVRALNLNEYRRPDDDFDVSRNGGFTEGMEIRLEGSHSKEEGWIYLGIDKRDLSAVLRRRTRGGLEERRLLAVELLKYADQISK